MRRVKIRFQNRNYLSRIRDDNILTTTDDENEALIFKVTMLDDDHFYLSCVSSDYFLSISNTLRDIPTILKIEDGFLWDGNKYLSSDLTETDNPETSDFIIFQSIEEYDEPDISNFKDSTKFYI